MKRSPVACAAVCLALASVPVAPVLAQNAQEIANLQRLIQAGEQTLQRETYLAQYCSRLAQGDAILHRGLLKAGHDPIVALTRWDNHVNQRVAAGRLTRAQGDGLIQEARRRRNELVNACNLANNRALLAKAQQGSSGVSAAAELTWNQDADYNQAIGAKGTVTGAAGGWQFTGQGTTSWGGGIPVSVTCQGRSIGLGEPNKLNGTLSCRATYAQGGRQHVRECSGNGLGRGYGYNATKAWYVAWPGHCIGTLTDAAGKPVSWRSGYIIIPVPSQESPLNF